jgi:hypothetical protein
MEKLILIFKRLARVFLAGLFALLCALVFSELVTYPKSGFKLDITTMPLEAQEILNESKGTPRTADQWRRVDKVLYEHGWSDSSELFYRAQLHSWYWYVLFPIVVGVFLRRRWKSLKLSEFFLLSSPCSILLIVCMVSVPPLSR